MKFKTFAVAVCCAASSVVAHANSIDQFKAFAKTTQSARGEFSQRGSKAGRPGPASTGVFAFARPGKFRWTYRTPFEQVLVADGVKLWIWDKDLNQVTVKPLGNALGESPAAILFGSGDLDRAFVLTDAGTRDGLEWIEATPRGKEGTFNRVSIGFRNGLPEAMELLDAFGQTSKLAFTHIERNAVTPADQFVFVPPKGADVFQQ